MGLCGAVAICHNTHAGTVTKLGTGTDLNADASWDSVAPGSADIATWTSLSLGAGLTFEGDTSWLGISVTNALSDIDMTGAGVLTLGSSGIDMSASARSLALTNILSLGGDQTWLVNTGRSLTLGSVFSGSAALTVGGDGTVTLAGQNNAGYTGVLTVNRGTVITRGGNTANGALGGATGVTINNGGTLECAVTDNSVFGNVGTTVPILINAGGLLTIDAGRNSHTHGIITLNGGTLGSVDAGNASYGTWYFDQNFLYVTNFGPAGSATSAITAQRMEFTGAGTVYVDAGCTVNVSGYWVNKNGGTSSLEKTGNGTMVLSGANTYSGGTTISGGTLQIGNGGSGAAVSEQTGIVDNAALVFNNGDSASYGGVISGSGSVAHSGSGTLTLWALNTYSGSTTVSGGALEIAAGTYPGPAAVTGGALRLRAAVLTSALPVTNGLVVRFDASAITGLADGATVGTWNDTSGLGNNATLASGTPTYVAGALNGLPIVRFPADGKSYLTMATRRTDIRTVFWVVNEANITGSGFHFFLGDSSNYDFHRGASGLIWNSTYASGNVKNGTTRLNGLIVNGTTTLLGTGWNMLDLVTAGNVAASRLTLDRTQSARSWAGDVAEVIIYNTVLTVAQVKQVEAYLNLKWFGIIPAVAMNGDVSVSGGAALGGNGSAGTVTVANGGTIEGGYSGAGTLTLSNLTFSGSGTLIVSPSGSYVPLDVTNALTVDGVVAITVANAPPAGSTNHVLRFASLGGPGSFVLTPTRRPYSLQTNAPYLDLVVGTGALSYPIWTGGSSAEWSMNSIPAPKNWKLNTDGSATDFITGDAGVFDDTASRSAISLTGVVTAGALQVNNTTPYGFGGSGSLVAASLTKGLGGAVTFTNTGGLTFSSGTTLNAGSLTLAGTGGVHMGAVAVNAATLLVQTSTAMGDVTVNGGGLTLAAGSVNSMGNVAITVGTMLVDSTNSATGLAIGSGGTVQIGNGDANGKLPADINDNGLLVFNRTDNLSYDNVLSGTGSLVKNGGATLALTMANSHSGGTTVNGGTLLASAPNVTTTGAIGGGNVVVNSGATILATGDNSLIGNAGSVSKTITINSGGTVAIADNHTCHMNTIVLNGGTLSSAGVSATWGNWNLDAGVSTPGNGSVSSMTNGNAALTQTGGTVFDVGTNDQLLVSTILDHLTSVSDRGLIKRGAGTLVLSSANTYTGPTIVSNGTLTVDGAIGGSTVTVAGGTLRGVGTIGGAVTVLSGAILAPGSASLNDALTIPTLILGGEVKFRIAKNGGTLACNSVQGLGSVTYGGTLTVVNVTTDGTHFASGDILYLFPGTSPSGGFASYNLPSLPAGLSWDVSGLATSGSIQVTTTTPAPLFTPGAGAYASPLVVTISSDSGATIYYTLDGTYPPTTSSPHGISPVTVSLPANTNSLTIYAYASNPPRADSEIASATFSTVPTPTWEQVYGGSWTTAANWSNNVAANAVGATADFSTLTLVGDAAVTLDSTPIVGRLVFADVGNAFSWILQNGSAGSLVLDAGTNMPEISVLNTNTTIEATLEGVHGMKKTGDGVLTLTAQNTYTGGTTVNGGVLHTAGGNASPGPVGSGDVTVNSGGTILVGGDNSFVGIVTSSNKSITINSGGTITNAGSSTCHLNVLVMNGGVLGATTPNGGYGNWNFDQGVSTLGNGRSSLITGGNAALTQAGGTLFNIGSGDTLTVDAALDTTAGAGDNGLIKAGSGTLVLTATNSYIGITTVSNGTLLVNGVLANGAVRAVGGTLGGTGAIGGTLFLNGTVSPGTGVGTLTTADEAWSGGAKYLFELNSATSSTGWDQLAVNGALTVTATPSSPFTVKLASLTSGGAPGALSDFNASQDYLWTIAVATGGVAGFAPAAFVVDATGFANSHPGVFSVTNIGNTIAVSYVHSTAPVPPVLSGHVAVVSNGCQLSFSGPTGQSYKVRGTNVVSAPVASWPVLATGIFNGGGTYSTNTFTDAGAFSISPRRFYIITSP